VTLPATTLPARGRGRPPGPSLPPDEAKSRTVRARVTDAQALKFDRLGGADWLRERIDRARV
jgi:hypothetical protein